ncbi:MAG TPA: glycosyltransferase [Polyangiaceae bacterium]|nr:glycosyltransferase [Polyangiaceae bacterium]
MTDARVILGTVANVSASPVALVVPCFNEEARLAVGLLREARLDRGRLDLVLVDDGSTDATRSLLEQIRDHRPDSACVVAYDRNAGKAEAVRRGVLSALSRRPRAIGFWDADLATPLQELPGFVDVLERRPDVDVVIGSRVKLMGRSIERRAWRHYVGRLFATAASLTLDLPVYDTQCGAKLFRVTPTLEQIFRQPFLATWAFDVEVLARFAALHPEGPAAAARAIYELPLGRWMDVRGSKLKPGDFARAALDLARIRRAYPPRRSAG